MFTLPKEGEGDEYIIRATIDCIGDAPSREGVKDTPKRVLKMWKEIYRGYDPKQKPMLTVFANGADGIKYDELIMDSGTFYSTCEHHMVPFFGQYYFAYIPGKKILGLSKVARIVEYYAAKLQVQERLTTEIVDEIERALNPKGIALVLKGRHLCKEMRGVKQVGGAMTTVVVRGVFKSKPEARAELMSLINNNAKN